MRTPVPDYDAIALQWATEQLEDPEALDLWEFMDGVTGIVDPAGDDVEEVRKAVGRLKVVCGEISAPEAPYKSGRFNGS